MNLPVVSKEVIVSKCDAESCGAKSTLKCPSCNVDILCCLEHQQEYWNHKTACCLVPSSVEEHIVLPIDNSFLFVSGGSLSSAAHFTMDNIRWSTPNNMYRHFVAKEQIYRFDDKKKFMTLLKSGQFSACFLYTLSSAELNSFMCEEVKIYVTAWVKSGGKLIVISEEDRMLTMTNEWFQKEWSFVDQFLYEESDHSFAPSDISFELREIMENVSKRWPRNREEIMPHSFRGRIRSLLNVARTECMYVTHTKVMSSNREDLCSVAAAKYKLGRVCFIGVPEVISDKAFPRLLLGLGAIDERYKRNIIWHHRRNFIRVLSGCRLLRGAPDSIHGKRGGKSTAEEEGEEPLEGEIVSYSGPAVKVFTEFYLCKLIVSYL